MTGLPTWDEQLEALEPVVDRLMTTWRPDGYTQNELQDMNKLALSILACGYLCHVYTDERRPVFLPLWNYAFNQGGPNPGLADHSDRRPRIGTGSRCSRCRDRPGQ